MKLSEPNTRYELFLNSWDKQPFAYSGTLRGLIAEVDYAKTHHTEAFIRDTLRNKTLTLEEAVTILKL